MKRFVTRDQVADYLKVTATAKMEAHIAAAEWLVTNEILTSSLHERSVEEKYRLLYDIGRDEVLELRDGPSASWDPDSTGFQFTIDGTEIDDIDDVILGAWTVKPHINGFCKNTTIVMRRKVGYTAANIPENLRVAMIMTAGSLFKHPDQALIMEKIGDYTRQTASLTAGVALPALTPQVLSLIRGYRKPRI